MSKSFNWKKIIYLFCVIGAGIMSFAPMALAVEAKNPFDSDKDFISASGGGLANEQDKTNARQEYQAAQKKRDELKAIVDEKYDIADDLTDDAIGWWDFKTRWIGRKLSFENWISGGDDGDLVAKEMEWVKEEIIKLRNQGKNGAADKWQKALDAYKDYIEAWKPYAEAEKQLSTMYNPDDVTGEDEVYYYTTKNGDRVYFIKNGDSYESISGVTKGCIPLPAKIAENASCIFCPLFLTIFNAAQTMATNAYSKLADPIAGVMVLGFAIYIAFLVLKYVSAFTKQDAPKFTNEIFQQAFKVLVAFLLLMNASEIYTYVIGPVLSAGMEFGGALLFADGNSYTEWCAVEKNLEDEVARQSETIASGVFPEYLYVKLSCFIRSVQAEISTAQSIGSSLMCVSRNVAAQSIGIGPITIIENAIWDFSMFFQGLLIWILALIISLAFAFYLIDATVRLGIIGALMPFLIACWPFKKTSGYTGKGWEMFLNTFFTYAMMGLIVSVNLQLIMQGLTGSKGGTDELMELIDGNNIRALQEMLDIGFAGFLVLLGCCLFGWKLTGQATALAGTFASGGGSPIAPQIGGLAASGAKAATLGGVGLGKAAMDATGVTAKARQGWDWAKSTVGRAIGLGKYSGKAAKQGGNTAPAQFRQPQTQQPQAQDTPQSRLSGANSQPDRTGGNNTRQQQRRWSDLLAQENRTTDPTQRANIQQERQRLEDELRNNPQFAYNSPELLNNKKALEQGRQQLERLRTEQTANRQRMLQLDQAINGAPNAAAAAQAQQQRNQLEQRNAQLEANMQTVSQQNNQLYDKLSQTAGTEENLSRMAAVNKQIDSFEANKAAFNNQSGRETYENSISPERHQQEIDQVRQQINADAQQLSSIQQAMQVKQNEIAQAEAALQHQRAQAARDTDPASQALYARQIQERESAIAQARKEFSALQGQQDSTQKRMTDRQKYEQSLQQQTQRLRSDWNFYTTFMKPKA